MAQDMGSGHTKPWAAESFQIIQCANRGPTR